MVLLLPICVLFIELFLNSISAPLPARRSFTNVRGTLDNLTATELLGTIRVLQFNLLADGLSGRNADLGAFSRVQCTDLQWSQRKEKLLHECLQYNPDIITLQECDHYYDFFSPQLTKRGYEGLFAAKQSSNNPLEEGCAIFYKTSKVRLRSVEAFTYNNRNKRLMVDIGVQRNAMLPPKLPQESHILYNRGNQLNRKAVKKEKNQIALIAVCDWIAVAPTNQRVDSAERSTASTLLNNCPTSIPPCSIPIYKSTMNSTSTFANTAIDNSLQGFVVATTHLKATKNAYGERDRQKQIDQLLNRVKEIATRTPVELRTTSCSSYLDNGGSSVQVKTLGVLPVLLTGDFNSCPAQECGCCNFECTVYDSVLRDTFCQFRSVMNQDWLPLMHSKFNVGNEIKHLGSSPHKASVDTCDDGNYGDQQNTNQLLSNYKSVSCVRTIKNKENEGSAGFDHNYKYSQLWTTWKARRLANGQEKVVKHCSDYIFYSSLEKRPHSSTAMKTAIGTEQHPSISYEPGAVGFRAVTALNILGKDAVCKTLLPSPSYPSDHIALVADLELIQVKLPL